MKLSEKIAFIATTAMFGPVSGLVVVMAIIGTAGLTG